MTDAKVDPAALAERLEQAMEPGVHVTDMNLAEVVRDVIAALRQRPQEERPGQCVATLRTFPKSNEQCARKAVIERDGKGYCYQHDPMRKPQAPEERPDLIALEQWRDRLGLSANPTDWQRADLLDRVLSALRAQPANYTALGEVQGSADNGQPAPAERTALERTPEEFNLNDRVWVKLQRRGLNAIAADPLAADVHRHREERDGWTRWQLWDLMSTLGHLCIMGPEPPFHTIMRFDPPAGPQARQEQE